MFYRPKSVLFAFQNVQGRAFTIIDQEPEPDFSEAIIHRGLAIDAYKALHHLPEPYREVFTLRTFSDLNYREIAEVFGKSESWARVTCYRAKRMLQDALKGANSHE